MFTRWEHSPAVAAFILVCLLGVGGCGTGTTSDPVGTSVMGIKGDMGRWRDGARDMDRDRDEGGNGDRDNKGILAPGEKFRGISQGEWGARWWTWALSQPLDTNPLTDTTGADCGNDQDGPVWFLAGEAFGVGPVVRNCTIPPGKHLFFPLSNYLADSPCPPGVPFVTGVDPDPGNLSPVEGAFLTGESAAVVDFTDSIDAAIDGVAVKHPFDYRAHSRLFAFTGDPTLGVMDACMTFAPQPGVADGYWLMLEPLAPGKHTITFQVPAFQQDVTYHLTVGH